MEEKIRIYIQKETLKGFPTRIGSKSEETAQGWAGADRIVLEHENKFENAKILGISWRDCNGGNCWKISIQIDGSNIIFDLREQKLLEILQKSSVINGIIQCPLAVIDRNEFAMIGGEAYNDWMKQEEVKKTPKISNKDLVIGTSYSTGLNNSDKKVFLGKHKINGKNSLCFGEPTDKWTWCKEPLHFCDLKFMTSTKFKVIGKHYDNYVEMIEESIRENEESINERNKDYEDRVKNYNDGVGYSWKWAYEPTPPDNSYYTSKNDNYRIILKGLKDNG